MADPAIVAYEPPQLENFDDDEMETNGTDCDALP